MCLIGPTSQAARSACCKLSKELAELFHKLVYEANPYMRGRSDALTSISGTKFQSGVSSGECFRVDGFSEEQASVPGNFGR